mmetsp:Transcript_30717/g.56133  ORF Transcript_30717/g.56133 Transcript_30717/m.56133 type:complete len:233 (-) Transcript_30717:18-716(-)
MLLSGTTTCPARSMDQLMANRQEVLQIARRKGRVLERASEELRSDREVVLAAVCANGCALKFAATALREDRELVKAAAKQNGMSLKYASTELLADSAFVLEALTLSFPAAQPWDAVPEAAVQLIHDEALQTVAGNMPWHFVLRVKMMSGRTCVRICEPDEPAASVARRCVPRLHLTTAVDDMEYMQPYFLDAVLVLHDEVLDDVLCVQDWPGIARGVVNEVMLVVKSDDDPD